MENKVYKLYTVRQIVEMHIEEIQTQNIWFIWGGEYPWEVPLYKFNSFLEAMPAYDLGVQNGQLHIRLEGEEHDHNSPEWKEHLQDIKTMENQRRAQKKYMEKLRKEDPEKLQEFYRKWSRKRKTKRDEVHKQLLNMLDANL